MRNRSKRYQTHGYPSKIIKRRSNALNVENDSFLARAVVDDITLRGPGNSSSVCRSIRRSAIRNSATRGSAVGGSTICDRSVCSDRNRKLAMRIMPTCDTLPTHQLLPILLFEEVHPTGGSLQPVSTLTPRSASPAHRSSITQSPRHTTSYTSGTPPLSLWRWRVVQSQLLSYDWDLGMISRPPHPMTPDHLLILKQELSTNLFEVAAG